MIEVNPRDIRSLPLEDKVEVFSDLVRQIADDLGLEGQGRNDTVTLGEVISEAHLAGPTPKGVSLRLDSVRLAEGLLTTTQGAKLLS